MMRTRTLPLLTAALIGCAAALPAFADSLSGPAFTNEFFMRADINKDGMVTRDEAMKMAGVEFDRLMKSKAAKGGMIDINAYFAMMRAQQSGSLSN